MRGGVRGGAGEGKIEGGGGRKRERMSGGGGGEREKGEEGGKWRGDRVGERERERD